MDNDVKETGSSQAGYLPHGKILLTIDDYAAKENISREQAEDKIREGQLLTRRHKGQVFIIDGSAAETLASARDSGDGYGDYDWPKSTFEAESPEEIKRTYQAQTQVLANEVQLRWQWQRIAVFLIIVVVIMVIGSIWSNLRRQSAASAIGQQPDDVTASFDSIVESQQKVRALQQELDVTTEELLQAGQQLSRMGLELIEAREKLAAAQAQIEIPADNLTSVNDELVEASAGIADLQNELDAAKQQLEQIEGVEQVEEVVDEEFELFDLQDMQLLE